MNGKDGEHPAIAQYDDRRHRMQNVWRPPVERPHVEFPMHSRFDLDALVQVAQIREEVAEMRGLVGTPLQGTWLYGDVWSCHGLALDQGWQAELATEEAVRRGRGVGDVRYAGVQTGKHWGPAEFSAKQATWVKPFTEANFLSARGRVFVVAHGTVYFIQFMNGAKAVPTGLWPYEKQRTGQEPFDWTQAKGITELVLFCCNMGATEWFMRQGMIEWPVFGEREVRDPDETIRRERYVQKRIGVPPLAREMASVLRIPVHVNMGQATVMCQSHLWAPRPTTALGELKALVGRYTQGNDFNKPQKKANELRDFVTQFGEIAGPHLAAGRLTDAYFDFFFNGRMTEFAPGRGERIEATVIEER